MVRLREIMTIQSERLRKFQFQYGAIKRNITGDPEVRFSAFQFQYGAIKREIS